mmetsp:Transcript_30/g.77  ORF Transcript_30/g.77 Transcript_30/m.77 type:complete len:365 (+) Transcript_30:124-1218(+)
MLAVIRPSHVYSKKFPCHKLLISHRFKTSVREGATRVAFVGLGNMGCQMALNLAKKREASGVENEKSSSRPDIHLIVHDFHQSSMDKFFHHADSGGLIDLDALSPASDLPSLAASDPHFVVTSLPSCEASETVVGEIVKNLPKPSTETGCIFIDTSTISPTVSKSIQKMVTLVSPKHDYVDAPVSGGVKGATNATLSFMVGTSSSETFALVQPLLQKMGKGIIPCGGPGSGSAVKLCNNAALAAQMMGICEAMNLGDALGVDPVILAKVMNVSTAKCWSSEVNNPHPDAAKEIGSGASAHKYEGGFGTALMLKDLNLAVDCGEEQGLVLPISGMTRDWYRLADKHGYGKKDFGVMLQFLKGAKV